MSRLNVPGRGNAAWLVLSVLVIVIDQWTKYLAVTGLVYQLPFPVTPFLNLTLTYNSGAAFSFLADAGEWARWLLTTISIVVSGALVVWLVRMPANAGLALPLALSLIIGGALGNAWDRLVLGVVVDFVDLYWRHWHWPAFNVADSAITVGAATLVIASFRSGPPSDAPAR